MIVDLPKAEGIERIIRGGIEKEINEIVEQEIVLAKERVASRVAEMKQGAIGRILSKFRITQVQSPEAWSYILKFEL